MKYLILSMFITVFTAGAQIQWPKDTSLTTEMRHYYFADEPRRITVQGELVFPTDNITVSDLEGYLAECEADSTEFWGPKIGIWDGRTMSYGNFQQWRKREPTLKGFLEYLKRQKKW